MSFTSSFLQLDGIEFKISDSLQSPNMDCGLPSHFRMNDPSHLLLESQYDFSKERKVLEKIKAVREAEKKMEEQEEKRKQQSLERRNVAEKRLLEEMMIQQREVLQRQRELFLEQKRKQKENSKNGESSTPDRVSPTAEPALPSRTSPTFESVSDVPPPIPPRNPFLQVGKDDILTPQPAARRTQEPSSPSQMRSNDSQPAVPGQNQIWVDFEDKELDPFTNMELKTIDDIAELQSVLQNVKLGEPLNQDSTANLAEQPEYLPSYDEATSPDYGTTSAPPEVSMSHNDELNVSSEDTAPKLEPVLDVTAISFSMLSSRDEFGMPKDESAPVYENVGKLEDIVPKGEKRAAPNQPERNSPELSQKPQTLYENVSFSKVEEIEKKMDKPTPQPSNDQNLRESIYEFAEESTSTSQNNKLTDRASPTFEKTTVKSEYPTTNQAAFTGPENRGVKLPDQISTGSIQSFPVQAYNTNSGNPFGANPFVTQQQPSSSIATPPVLQRQTHSHSDLFGTPSPTHINTIFPPPEHYTSTGGAKVLPVSFGVVSNSLSATNLPPVANGSMTHKAPGSASTPNQTQAPVPLPRKPPVPPRDPAAKHTFSARTQFTPRPPQSSSNGPTPTGHTHLLPPYALPQSNDLTTTKPSVSPVLAPGNQSPTPQKSTSAPAVTDTSFLQKSLDDRVKFAETVNKALSSLPKNPPKPVVKHKPTTPALHENSAHEASNSQAFSNYKPLPSRGHSLKSSLLVGLSSEEQEFISNVTSIGFDMKATIRATQKYGLDQEKVIDHLCTVKDISDQGYPTNTVQDALELFTNDNKSVIKYLHHASQLMDMGFKEDDIREALKANNNDQTKALDQLMGQT